MYNHTVIQGTRLESQSLPERHEGGKARPYNYVLLDFERTFECWYIVTRHCTQQGLELEVGNGPSLQTLEEPAFKLDISYQFCFAERSVVPCTLAFSTEAR
jgi:hypothetical protein